VDPQVKTPEGKYYDVLFIGTGMSFNVPVDSKNSIDIFVYFFFCKIKDNGKVIKAVRTDAGQPVVIEEIQVFPVSVPVTNMMIHRGKMGGGADGSSEEPRLVVSSQSEIASFKLQRCYSDKVSTCR
jgi:hypothetical protein